jgi:chromosome segregation ATPase
MFPSFQHEPTIIQAKRAEKSRLIPILGGQFLIRKGEWEIIGIDNIHYKITDETFQKLYKIYEPQEERMIKNKKENLAENLVVLEEKRRLIEKQLEEAQGFISAAKIKRLTDNVYADAKTFGDMKSEIRLKTNELHDINRQIKSCRKQLCRSNPTAAYFKEAAKLILDEETYIEINEMAKQWIGK